jgi:hypothetical protein
MSGFAPLFVPLHCLLQTIFERDHRLETDCLPGARDISLRVKDIARPGIEV